MMKKFKLIILLALFIGLVSCQKPLKDPVLNMSQTVASVITSPQNGSLLVLKKEQTDSTLTISWSATEYNLTELALTNYSLEMDFADSSFSKPIVIASSTSTSYSTTVGALNTKLKSAFKVEPGDTVSFAYRVRAFINNSSDYSEIYSAPITIAYSTYSDVVIVSPIYMLGSATLAGWDNTMALEMTHLADGKFSIISTLTAGTDMYVKFISDLGAWAPQWGTDAEGTSEAGNLVYRPTEDVPDPPGIPGPDVTGEYLIIADTANLTYTITLATEVTPPPPIYMLGSATAAGWDNTKALEMTYVSGGKFSIVATLTTGTDMFVKFISDLGKWAPQWGTDATGTSAEGPLVYRPTEDVPDPPAIPAPSTTGQYLIEADTATLMYTISPR
ncbi:MAG TPA: SusE domain-containing protein [Bacteroidales bacterium]